MSQLPPAFAIQSARIRSNAPNFGSESKSLITHVRRIPAHRWEFVLRSKPMLSEQVLAAFAWQAGLKGSYGVFTAVIPYYSHTKGVGSGSPTVRTVASPGATSIQLQGFSGPVAGQLKAGDFIKFANHSKCYMVLADVNSNVNGQLTIQITPELRKPLTVGTAVQINNVPFTLRQRGDIQEFNTDGRDGRISTLELDCYEAL